MILNETQTTHDRLVIKSSLNILSSLSLQTKLQLWTIYSYYLFNSSGPFINHSSVECQVEYEK